MKLIARVLKLRVRLILFVLSVPLAVLAFYSGLSAFLCAMLVVTLVWFSPFGLEICLEWLARKRFRAAYPYYKRAGTFFEQGEYDLAIAEMSTAIRIDPDNARAYMSRAGYCYLKGEYDLAIADCTTAMNIDPKLRGLGYESQWDRNAGEFELALAHYDRGKAYYAKEEYDLAISDFDAAIHINHPWFDLARAYNHRGLAHKSKGEYDLAIADFGAAIEIESRYAEYYNNLGLVYLAIDEYDLAIANFNTVIDIDPGGIFSLDAYENRGRAYEAKGEHENALADLEVADRIIWRDADDMDEDDKAASHHLRARYYCEKGDYELGIAEYSKAIVIDPLDEAGYNNHGLAYLAKKEYDLAIADFDAAIRINPGIWVAYENRDKAYIGKYDAAISLDPTSVESYLSRGYTYYSMGEHDVAITDYTAAIGLDSTNAESYNCRGLSYHTKREYDLAIADYSTAIELASDSELAAYAYNNRASAYEDQRSMA